MLRGTSHLAPPAFVPGMRGGPLMHQPVGGPPMGHYPIQHHPFVHTPNMHMPMNEPPGPMTLPYDFPMPQQAPPKKPGAWNFIKRNALPLAAAGAVAGGVLWAMKDKGKTASPDASKPALPPVAERTEESKKNFWTEFRQKFLDPKDGTYHKPDKDKKEGILDLVEKHAGNSSHYQKSWYQLFGRGGSRAEASKAAGNYKKSLLDQLTHNFQDQTGAFDPKAVSDAFSAHMSKVRGGPEKTSGNGEFISNWISNLMTAKNNSPFLYQDMIMHGLGGHEALGLEIDDDWKKGTSST